MLPFALGLNVIGIEAVAPGANGPKEPPLTANGAIETVDHVTINVPRPTFLIARFAWVVCPAGPLIVIEGATDSLPARPTPFTITPIVGCVASLLAISTDPESFNASGWNVTVSGCDPPGAISKVGGLTLNTDAPAGGAINI